MNANAEAHRQWLQSNINVFIKPLMVDLLKERPDSPLDYMIFWLQTAGKKIERQLAGDVEAQKDVEHLPDSDEDEVEESGERADEISARLAQRGKEARKKLGISAEAYGEYNQLGDYTPRLIAKSEEQLQQIRERLSESFMFKCLDEAAREIVIGAMEIKEFAAGDRIIEQGADGHELYLVSSGSLDCFRRSKPDAEPALLKTYVAGDVFGELALLYNTPRSATIVATTPAVCFSLDRDTFSHIVQTAAVKNRQLYDDFLNRIDILRELDSYERSKLCDCLQKEVFRAGDFIIRQGETGDKFYLVQQGTAEALKDDGNGEVTKVFDYSENDYFGELALLNNDVRQASIRVTSDVLVVATMSRAIFKRLLGPIEKILQRNSDKYAQYVKGTA